MTWCEAGGSSSQIRDRVVHAIAVSEYNAEELRRARLRRRRRRPADARRHAAQRADARTRRCSLGSRDGQPTLSCCASPSSSRTSGSSGCSPRWRCSSRSTGPRPVSRSSASTASRPTPAGLRAHGPHRRASGSPTSSGGSRDAELSALYLRADVFLTLSEHEGFCVPVVEAMAVGVPVVASRRAAIPSTVGDAGLLIDEPDDPALAAAAIDRLVRRRPTSARR